MKLHPIAAAAIAVTLLLSPIFVPGWSEASGVRTLVTVFVSHRHPDLPLDKFAAGRLGLIKRTWAVSYRYTAYRDLVGLGFNPAEQQALVSLWDQRLGLPRPGETAGAPVSWLANFTASGIEEALSRWVVARNRVPGVEIIDSVGAYRRAQTSLGAGKFVIMFSYPNCNASTFATATGTLQTMAGKFGIASAEVERWVAAQDEVFDNCSGPSKFQAASTPPAPPAADIPPPLTSATPFEQAQRAYQIACAYFYSGEFDEAAQMFRAIAADRSSPWHDWGLYLAARATIRKATLSGAKNDPAILADAEAQLNAIIAAPGDDQVKRAARSLLSFVEFHLHPHRRTDQVARALMQPNRASTLAQDLDDYSGNSGDGTQDADGFYVDDLTDWIASFNEYNGSVDHSIAKWKKSGSLPWLIAAIAQTPGSDPNAPVLIEAAEKVKPDSPAYVTVTFHAARLLIEQGKIDQARPKLDALLAMRNELPRSAINEVAGLRMRVARNLTELLTYAQRIPIAVTDTGDAAELSSDLYASWIPRQLVAGPLFDRDGAALLSRWTPLSIQARAAQSRILADDLRGRLALAAWTRAILVDDDAAARELAPVVGKLVAELKPSMDRWLAAKDPRDRRFDAAFIMLTHPGMRPYVDAGVGRITPLAQMNGLRDNWWRFPSWSENELSGRGRRPPPTTYPMFLSAAEKKSADDHWLQLKATNAPNYLCAAAIGESKRKPRDERVPQALYQCISAVHLGCSNDQGSDYAKSAFSNLHRRYPDSVWALKNRFWYRGGNCGMPY